MSRQITFFKFECGIREFVQQDADTYKLVSRPVCVVEDSSLTKSDIRKAIIDAGFECPRGTDVYAVKVGKVQYKFTTEALKSICESREELPLD